MTVSIDLFNWERRAEALVNTLATKARNIARSEAYTPAGKLEQWERVKDTYSNDVDDLAAELRFARRGAEQVMDYARAAAVGEAPDPAKPDVGVELAVARLLARHQQWDVNAVTETLDPIMGTQTAAVFMDELVKRGSVDVDLLEALLEKMNPAIGEARQTQKYALTLINSVLRPVLEELEELLDRGPLAAAVNGGGDIHRKARASMAETAGTGTFTVSENGAYVVNTDRLAGGHRG